MERWKDGRGRWDRHSCLSVGEGCRGDASALEEASAEGLGVIPLESSTIRPDAQMLRPPLAGSRTRSRAKHLPPCQAMLLSDRPTRPVYERGPHMANASPLPRAIAVWVECRGDAFALGRPRPQNWLIALLEGCLGGKREQMLRPDMAPAHSSPKAALSDPMRRCFALTWPRHHPLSKAASSEILRNGVTSRSGAPVRPGSVAGGWGGRGGR